LILALNGRKSSTNPIAPAISTVPMNAAVSRTELGKMTAHATIPAVNPMRIASPHISGNSFLSSLWTSLPVIPWFRITLPMIGVAAKVTEKDAAKIIAMLAVERASSMFQATLDYP
jgi:hypothetical protein